MKHFGALTLFFVFVGQAHAVLLDPMLREKIRDACLARNHGPRAAEFCACVGTKHFRSAKQMPSAAQGNQDLRWILEYYAARDQRALAKLRADPDNLTTYDAFIGKECRKESRS